MHAVFDWLPIAALIADVALTLHGGIGDGKWGLGQLANSVPRPLLTLRDAPIMVAQALWSDPSDSDEVMAFGVHHAKERDPNDNYTQVGHSLAYLVTPRTAPCPETAPRTAPSTQAHPRWLASSPQVMKRFGPDVTETFCAREGVQLIIRSHQYVEEGVKFMHGGRLVTVFSARNYLRAAKNDGALLLLATDGHGHVRVRAKRLLHNK